MNKLEVGMYVRTQFGIDKIKFISEVMVGLDETLSLTLEKEREEVLKREILKASHKIIDLIEVGDYANGYYVSKIWEENEITHYVDETPIKRKERQITIQAPSYGGIIHLKNEDIKSIVTKEQFSSMSYKVGD